MLSRLGVIITLAICVMLFLWLGPQQSLSNTPAGASRTTTQSASSSAVAMATPTGKKTPPGQAKKATPTPTTTYPVPSLPWTYSPTPTPTSTATPTPTPTSTATPTPTPTATATPTPTPTATASPTPTPTPTPTPAPTLSRISAFGGNWYLLGYDYPWKDYSYDFGTTSNISQNYSAISSQFADMAANGTHVTRWFVLNDGTQALSFNSSGWVTGLKNPTAFYQNFDQMVAIAQAHNVFLIPDLLDGTFVSRTAPSGNTLTFTNSSAMQSYMDNVVKPILQRYGTNHWILAWSPVNEPDYFTTGVNPGSDFRAIPYANMQTFMRTFNSYVHTYTSQMSTIENGPLATTHYWTGLGFDFYSPHYYDWMDQYSLTSPGPMTTTAASWHLDKPIVLGELPSASSKYSVSQFINTLYNNGYAGAMFWSVNAGDSLSNYSGTKSQMATFAQAHATVVNIK